MAVQSPFFGKRETPPPVLNRARETNLSGGIPLNSGAAPTDSVTPIAQTEPAPPQAPAEVGGSKLTVGPNIKLKGVEITDCDTLVVEGLVEATMDSRVIQIAEQGAFHGSAEIDIAEIRGEFNGNLTVRQKLVIFSTGKVNGKIRYGNVVIEEGGQLAGEISFGTTPSAANDTKRSFAAPGVAREPLAA